MTGPPKISAPPPRSDRQARQGRLGPPEQPTIFRPNLPDSSPASSRATHGIALVYDTQLEQERLKAQLIHCGHDEDMISSVPIEAARNITWSPVDALVILLIDKVRTRHLNVYRRLIGDHNANVIVLGTETEKPFFTDATYLTTPVNIGLLADAIALALSLKADWKQLTAPHTELSKYQELFDSATDAVLLLDCDTHRIIAANNSAVALYDYTHEELVGMNALDLVPHDQHLATIRQTKSANIDGYDHTTSNITHVKKDGARLVVKVSQSPIEYGGKTVIQNVVHDETGRVELVDELRKKTQQLHEANEKLRFEIEERKRVEAEFRKLSLTDSLTLISNRRAFDERLEEEWRRAARSRETISLMLLDIDHFKSINDRFGHPFGDEVLRTIAQTLNSNCQRAGEMVARYGGEEFAILMANQDVHAAHGFAERLRLAIAGLALRHDDEPVTVTASIGVAGMRPDRHDSRFEIITLADKALYQAKDAGRNCVVTAHASDDEFTQRPKPAPTEEARLAALHSLSILDTPPEDRFDRLTRLAKRVFDVPVVLISLVDSNRQWFKSNVGLDTQETAREISFCTHAIEGKKILVVPDAAKDKRFADNPLVTAENGIRFYAGCPIKSPSGHALGTLCIIDQKPREMTYEDLDTLRDIASVVEQELGS